MHCSYLAILDYDLGNIRSISSALEKSGVQPVLTRDPKEILQSAGLILPGVGAFGKAMAKLSSYGLTDVIKDFIGSGKGPILGICLGMQLLFDESEEFGLTQGLRLIRGKVRKMPQDAGNKSCKLPHIGWDQLHICEDKVGDSILRGVMHNSNVYFVHSFVAEPLEQGVTIATADYGGYEFCAAVKKGHIYGCQFHPEKSAEAGLRIFKNFVNLVANKQDKGICQSN